jgi:plastocyanin
LFLFVFVLALSFKAQSATWTVNVKDDFYENPTGFNPVVGDSINWVWMGANPHTVTSTVVPGGAAPLSSPSQTTGTYGYKVTVAGNYVYNCTVHGVAMSGTFTATTATGIEIPKISVVSSAYPNPFASQVTINTQNVEQVVIYNATGQVITSREITSAETSSDFDLSGYSKGVYYYTTQKNGMVMERKPIIKTN